MAMLGVGGSIGTGLLLGSGAAVQIAGPAVILTYIVGAFLAGTVTFALGEMSSVHPSAGSFGVYADLYLHPWAGFVARYGYWVSVVSAIGAELVAAATYAQFWFPKLPGVVFVVLFGGALLYLNLRTVGDYGRFEYWFAMLKVVTILFFILFGAAFLFSGRVAPQYHSGGGFFPHGMGAAFMAVSFPLFSFLGIEMVAISSEEARKAAEIPRATRIMFAMLAFIYVGATAVLVGVIPWNRVGVSQSPFVSVFTVAGLPAASQVMNFIVLTAALSGGNANLYVAGRMLFSLARDGYAPKSVARVTNSGSPLPALLLSTFGIAVAIALELYSPQKAFLYILGASLFGGMLAWWVTLAAHISFRRRLTPEKLTLLPMRSPGGAVMSAIGFLGIATAIGCTWWFPQTRITLQTGIPFLLLLSLAYLLTRKRLRSGTISS